MSLTVHINSLPDLVLRRIFSKVPLTDLLHTGNVCPLWKYYQVETGKQVRSLTLFIGPTDTHQLITKSCFTLKYRDLLLNDDGNRMYSSQYLDKRFHLTFGSFTLDGFAQLSNIFPRITTLEIAIIFVRGQSMLSPMLLPLLAQWSPMLKSLKMYFQFNRTWSVPPLFNAKAANEILNILKAINSMQFLEHFTLETDVPISQHLNIPPIPPINPDSIDLPILNRLHEFFFRSLDSIHIMEQSFKRFGLLNVNLKQIGFHTPNYHQDLYGHLPQLASKIVTAAFYTIPRQLFNQFSSLISLSFGHYGHNPFNGELNLLASLPQLTYLYYTTYGTPFAQTPTQASRDKLRQLTSVKVLTIGPCLKSTSSFESNLWAHLFPNIQVIELNLQVSIRRKQEHHKIASTFVQCLKLHHIYTREKISKNSNSSYGKLEEVSAFEWTVLQVCDRKIIINTKQLNVL